MNEENYTYVIPYIACQREHLNQRQQKIADYILEEPSRVLQETSREVAEHLGVSEATVVRLCQQLGFQGYRDFRIRLAQDLGNDFVKPIPNRIAPGDHPADVMKKTLQIEYEDIKFTSDMLNDDLVVKVLDLITNCKTLAFFGVGSSSLVASTAKEHFLHYGKQAFAETEGLSQIILANTLGPGDVAFAISISGMSKLPIKIIEIANKRGADTICLTQNPSSPLARKAKYMLQVYRKDNSIDDLGSATRIVHIALIDALAVAYASQDWDYITSLTKENRSNSRDYL